MKILKKFVSREFVQDKFDRKYPFDLKNQSKGYFKKFGEKNPDKIFYVIWREWLGSGFFSNFYHVLLHIKKAEHFGMIPVVDFKNFKTLYNETNPIYGTQNAWEYYFKQPSEYDLEEVYSSKNVFFCNGELPTYQIESDFIYSDIYFANDEYRKFVNKYTRLQEYVEQEIKKYLPIFKEKILGIHFRGKEVNYAPVHGFGPTLEQMFRYTDEILSKYDIDKIFMVTEEKDFFDAFVKKYGKKVISYDSFRASKINAYNLKPRENHRYLLGLEILCEATLLSKCYGLLCSSSNVSLHASKSGDNKFVYFINNGRNVSNRYVARYLYGIKKLLPKNFGGLSDELKIISTVK